MRWLGEFEWKDTAKNHTVWYKRVRKAWRESETDIQTDRQTNRQRETDRQADRDRDRHKPETERTCVAELCGEGRSRSLISSGKETLSKATAKDKSDWRERKKEKRRRKQMRLNGPENKILKHDENASL